MEKEKSAKKSAKEIFICFDALYGFSSLSFDAFLASVFEVKTTAGFTTISGGLCFARNFLRLLHLLPKTVLGF